MDNRSVSKEWFKDAERDLESARFLYELEVNEQDMKSAIACAEKIQRVIIALL